MSKPTKAPVRCSRTSKVYKVAISQMRVPPAGVCQREFRPAWGAYLAANLRLEELGIPVLNKRDGHFWIIDGQHRIHALKENGFTKDDDQLECEVYDGLSDEEAAAVFDGRNTTKVVATIDRFLVRCTRGNDRECSVRRVVESSGLVIGRDRSRDKTIGCVVALGKAYDLAGPVPLGQAIRTLDRAFVGDAHAFDGALVEGITMVFNRYNGRTQEQEMVRALQHVQYGVRGIMRKAEAQRQRTGNQRIQCVAATIVDLYNKSARVSKTSKLPSWWKPEDCETDVP